MILSPKLERKIWRIIQLTKSNVKARHIHYTFICKRNRIICYGHNKIFKTHPFSAKFKTRFSDIHSELSAISRFPYRVGELSNYDFINVRLKRDNGLFGMAKPCLNCQKMLTEFKIKEIIYTNLTGEYILYQL